MIGNHQKIIPIDEKELLTKLQQITGPSRTVLLLSSVVTTVHQERVGASADISHSLVIISEFCL